MLEDVKKELRRKKASETRALKKKFESYVNEKTYKFKVVAEFKRPYKRLLNGWSEEESYEKTLESVDEFRKSFSFKDFRNGKIDSDDSLYEKIKTINKFKGIKEIKEDECKHKFEWMRPSHKRICVYCGEESTEKVFGTGFVDLKGKSYYKV